LAALDASDRMIARPFVANVCHNMDLLFAFAVAAFHRRYDVVLIEHRSSTLPCVVLPKVLTPKF
jgi:hypothetical protein